MDSMEEQFDPVGAVLTVCEGGLPSKKENIILDCLGSKEDPGNKSSSNNAQQASYGEGDDTDHGSDIEEDVMNKEHKTEEKKIVSESLPEPIERKSSTSKKNYCSPLNPESVDWS